MRALVASTSGAGHFHPLVPWLDALTAGGHEVLLVGPASLASTGDRWPFRAGAEPDPAVVGPMWGRLDGMADESAAAALFTEIVVRHNAGALIPAVEAAMAEFRPHIVVREPMEHASALVAARHDVPQVMVGISLMDEVDRYVEMASPWLDDWLDGLTGIVAGAPRWSRFPASVDPASAPVRRYRLGAAPQRDVDPRLVYATLGTVVPRMPHLHGWYDVLATSLAAADAEVVLTVGRELDPGSLAVGPHVSVRAWADHDDVLGRARVILHHGGSGTALDAMAAGCPQIVVPLFADQPANGAMVERSGIGRTLVGPGGFAQRRPVEGDAQRLTGLVAEALADDGLESRAREVAVEMASVPALEPALLADLEALTRP